MSFCDCACYELPLASTGFFTRLGQNSETNKNQYMLNIPESAFVTSLHIPLPLPTCLKYLLAAKKIHIDEAN